MPVEISLIVPTFNRRTGLERLLDALEHEAAHASPFEVVVVVDGSTDGTTAMLASRKTSYPTRVLEQANAGPGAARNAAMRAAVGEILIFLDDDVMPVPGLIERHRCLHMQDRRAVATGPMLPPAGPRLAPWLVWEAATLQKQYDAMNAGRWRPTPRQFYTANASVRREFALALGGFDETFRRAEDVEFAYRLADLGLRFYFLPEAAVIHEPDRTLQSWRRVGYDYGRYDVIMERTRGRQGILNRSYRESRMRHPLNRVLADWCVGHPRRFRLAVGLASWLLSARGPIHWRRAEMALCSAVFHLQYWQGIADETGSAAQVWRWLRKQQPLPPAPAVGAAQRR